MSDYSRNALRTAVLYGLLSILWFATGSALLSFSSRIRLDWPSDNR